MKHSGGNFDYSYNAQTALDDTAHIIVAAELIVARGREGKNNGAINAEKRPLCAAMAEKFKAAATQAAYRKRKWLSEPPSAWIKSVLGFRQFSMRGLVRAQAEWKLIYTALNLRRMAKMMAA